MGIWSLVLCLDGGRHFCMPPTHQRAEGECEQDKMVTVPALELMTSSRKAGAPASCAHGVVLNEKSQSVNQVSASTNTDPC